MPEARYNPALNRFAILTAVATFPLIFMGGLVTSHSAGMAVPDWPNSYGYNMFTFPISKWVGGIWYEHVHRLYASFVGFLSIILTLVAWKTESRRWVRWLATSVLGAVIFQGLLGGLRVVLVNLDLAVVHGVVAQLFFCLASILVVVTSRWWLDAPELYKYYRKRGSFLIRFSAGCFAIIVAQLVLGAMMRHYKAGLAVPDLPLSYGQVIPPGMDEINRQRSWTYNLDPVTSSQVWLHMSHRIGAIVVTVATTSLAVLILRKHVGIGLTSLAAILGILLVAQLTLGVVTVLMRKPADVASAHVAVGALALMTTAVTVVRAMRLYSTSCRAVAMRNSNYSREWAPPVPQSVARA